MRPALSPCRAVAAVLAAGSLLLAAGCARAAGQNGPPGNGQSFVSGDSGVTVYPAGARPAVPSVSGTTLTGAELSLAAYRGHVVVLNFWGSWCTPCRAEAPALAALDRHFRPDGVRFLGVDIRDSTAAADAFRRNFGITYPSLSDPSDAIALGFRHTVPPAGTPTTLVIGRSGQIVARVVGEASYSDLARLIGKAGQPA
ncbi:MAG: TlpA family protein disulfide reductase [Nocardiopsaceae bacterium]|jgi:thiol-disulfide isomerase/thioredoxin|nr:TlpA family protein disulfide reductase [Nocardiopsaceae bacterium]